MDIIENIKGSVIQHGPLNNRIYLMGLKTDDTPGLIATLDDMAEKNGYGKIFAKISAPAWNAFKSYPFPIQKPAYLKRMMKEGVLYFCIRIEGRIAAIAAAEIDLASKNAEMTDFATLSKWRGKGLAGMLLCHMDKKACELGLKTAYTIARAASYGMNSVFKNSGYNYAGLLKNNSQICGSIQSMTVWYKHITNHEKIFHHPPLD